jgi:hypothetical protein
MSHDVFISCSKEDDKILEAACLALESNGISCWYAPRDIHPGMDWSASIVDAIDNCRVFMLIFTANSNKSVQVKRETEIAVNSGKPFLPLRVEDVALSPHMRYYISTQQWLDAFTPPIEQHFQPLVNAVKKLLTAPSPEHVPIVQESSNNSIKKPASNQKPKLETKNNLKKEKHSSRYEYSEKWYESPYMLLIVLATIIISYLFFGFLKKIPPDKNNPSRSSTLLQENKGERHTMLTLTLNSHETAWVRIVYQDSLVEEGVFTEGLSRSWMSPDKFYLKIGNAGGIRLALDGQDLGTPGKKGEVVTIVVTKEGVAPVDSSQAPPQLMNMRL